MQEVETMESKENRISNLPEDLIHEIFNRLSMLDVARTSCVSKEWRSFCASLPFLNFDQQHFRHDLTCDRFKNMLDHEARSIREQGSVVSKFRLCMNLDYVLKSMPEVRRCVSLVIKGEGLKEFDFHINVPRYWPPHALPHDIYNAETLTVLRLSGCQVQPRGKIKLPHLQILCLVNVHVEEQSVIDEFITGCPLMTELRLVKCLDLRHLKVSGLGQLKLLEVGFCLLLQKVEIQAPGLQKLSLSEITRERFDGFHLNLSIDSKTCESLRELTMCNSSLAGFTFSHLFSLCSNVESLVLEGCLGFYKITIRSQKLRKIVMRKCFNIFRTDIEAPNLTSFNFCNVPIPDCFEKTSHLQECMLDLQPYVISKDIWLSLWYDKFKKTVGQKIIIFPKCVRYDAIVLESWSLMAELPFMIMMGEAAMRIIVTTMNFDDLAEYLFRYYDSYKEYALAISSRGESKLYEVLRKKPNISCERCFSVVIAKTNEQTWSVGIDSFDEALLEAGMTATLKATSLSVKLKFNRPKPIRRRMGFS